MNKITSIIPDILFFRFSNDLWHILRAHGFGVAIQNGCSAIISVDESILCTMDQPLPTMPYHPPVDAVGTVRKRAGGAGNVHRSDGTGAFHIAFR